MKVRPAHSALLRAHLLPCLAMKASMSSLVMRPPMPVPETLPRSTLFSLAMRRTSGLERTRS